MWRVCVWDVPYFLCVCVCVWFLVFFRGFGFGFFGVGLVGVFLSNGSVALWECSLRFRDLKVPDLHVYL